MKTSTKCITAVALILGLSASFSVMASPCSDATNWSKMHGYAGKICHGHSNVYQCRTAHLVKPGILHVRITKLQDHGDAVMAPKVGKTINYHYGTYTRAQACAMLYHDSF